MSLSFLASTFSAFSTFFSFVETFLAGITLAEIFLAIIFFSGILFFEAFLTVFVSFIGPFDPFLALFLAMFEKQLRTISLDRAILGP